MTTTTELPPIIDLASAQAVITQLSTWALKRGILLRPAPPLPTGCCGRGCNGCVWESYFAAALYWQEHALEKLAPEKLEYE